MIKNLPANAGDSRDVGLMAGVERSWRRAWQPTLVFLPGESQWTKEPDGLLSMRSQRVGQD